jgi:hypothetical protein
LPAAIFLVYAIDSKTSIEWENSVAYQNQLIPPPELAPPSIKHLPVEKRIEIWAQLVDDGEALVLGGLRAKIGPEGDLKEAYREWYRRRMEEHDRALIYMLMNLTARERLAKKS